MTIAAGWVLLGLIALVLGGELLVRGAAGLAALAGISPLVIGLTVVAFGTSAPELAVSLKAGYAGEADIAMGNVIGSNICNTLLILGLSAVVVPLAVSSRLIRLEVPFMIAVSVAVWVMSLDRVINRFEGVALFSTLLIYIAWSILQSRRERLAVKQEFAQEYEEPPKTMAQALLLGAFIAGGLVALSYGSDWLVFGASQIARALGMSELLIGLTVVALGTSLPEVVASVMASIKGERDIAVGNVVGSNLFNLMCVLGVTAALVPNIPVAEAAIRQEMPIMIGTAVFCFPIFLTGSQIYRWEGALFLLYFVAYMSYLILHAISSPLAKPLADFTLYGMLPLTVLALIISAIATRRRTAAEPHAENGSES